MKLGTRYGRCRMSAGLYAPGALPMLEWWSPILERLGRRLVTELGAFQVLTIELPPAGSDGANSRPPR